jgi:hypothetical protein
MGGMNVAEVRRYGYAILLDDVGIEHRAIVTAGAGSAS